MPMDGLPSFPPPSLSPAHARVTYTREDSLSPHRSASSRRFSHSRGRPPAFGGSKTFLREQSTSTNRGSDWLSSASEGGEESGGGAGTRGRSESRDGSRAPLWRGISLGRSTSRMRAAGNVELMEKDVASEGSSRKRWWSRLGPHFLGMRGERGLPTPLLPFLARLPLRIETPILSFLGGFPSILVCCAISSALSGISGSAGEQVFDHLPLTVGSLGATAVLLYAVPEGPLSQPRNLVGGHLISAVIGCIISELFALSPAFRSPLVSGTVDNQVAAPGVWGTLTPVAASLAVALSILAMQLTGTIHPPGGATALIAAYHTTSRPRWTYLLVVFFSVVWMGLWAIVVNNLGRRRYPAYWWTPPPPDSGPTAGAPSPKLYQGPPAPAKGKPSAVPQHFEHAPSDNAAPTLSPERDLQQRWLGRLGEEDEEALAEGYDEQSGRREEEEGRGRRARRER
ncbi:hypothetical protein JCM10213_008007 [Rhodosporidiobolus nylandii]